VAQTDVLVQLRRAHDHADRWYATPMTLEELASVACMSKYHFLRLFRETYGITPMEYVSRRRIERAQDLLRATNLTVTEVCFAVGFSSLGSFSSRFRALVGESASDFQRRYADGAPHIPGCFIFMWGLAEQDRSASKTAIAEKPKAGATS
jgi:transcriptional regulator GlxA family with amidase domain